jgi:FxLD family lantipeptide
MTPPASPASPPVADAGDFELDIRFIENAVLPGITMCDTDDTCGSTCDTTACNSASDDPS